MVEHPSKGRSTLGAHGAHMVLVLALWVLLSTVHGQGCQVHRVLQRLESSPANETFVNVTNQIVTSQEIQIATVSAASDWLRSGDSSFFSQDEGNATCLFHLELNTSSLVGTPCSPSAVRDTNSWIAVRLHYGSTFIQSNGPPFPYTPYYPWYPLDLSATVGFDSYGVRDLDGDPTVLHLEIPSPSNPIGMTVEVWKPAGEDVPHFPDAMINVTLDVIMSCHTNITSSPCPTIPTVPWSSDPTPLHSGHSAHNTSATSVCSHHGQCVPVIEAPVLSIGLKPSRCLCEAGHAGPDCSKKILPLTGTTVTNVTLRHWSYFEIMDLTPGSTVLRVSAELMNFPRYSMDVYGSPFLLCVQQFGAGESLHLMHVPSSVEEVGGACDVVGAAAGRTSQFMVMDIGNLNLTSSRIMVSLFGRDRASFRTSSIDGLFLQDQDLLHQKSGGTTDSMQESGSGGGVLTPEIVSFFQVTLRYSQYSKGVRPVDVSCPSPPGFSEPCGLGECVDLATSSPDAKRNVAQDREYEAYNRNYGSAGWYGVKNATAHCHCGPGTTGSDCSGNMLQLNSSAEYETLFEHDELTVYILQRSGKNLRVTMKPLACLAVWDPFRGLHRLVMPQEASAKQPFHVENWVPGASDPYAHYNTMLTASLPLDNYAFYRGRARIVRLMISRHNCMPSCWITANRTELQQSGFLFHQSVSVPGSECASLENILADAGSSAPASNSTVFRPKYTIKLQLTNAPCDKFPCSSQPMHKPSADWLWQAFLPVGCVFAMQVAIIALIYVKRQTCLNGPDSRRSRGTTTQTSTDEEGAHPAFPQAPSKWTSLPETIIQGFPTYTFQSPFTLTPHPRKTQLHIAKDPLSQNSNQAGVLRASASQSITPLPREGIELQARHTHQDQSATPQGQAAPTPSSTAATRVADMELAASPPSVVVSAELAALPAVAAMDQHASPHLAALMPGGQPGSHEGINTSRHSSDTWYSRDSAVDAASSVGVDTSKRRFPLGLAAGLASVSASLVGGNVSRRLSTSASSADVAPVFLDEHRGGQCCMICLEEYADGDILMGLPCMHCFHSECIRGWLGNNATCPACRLELLPCDDVPEAGTSEQPTSRSSLQP